MATIVILVICFFVSLFVLYTQSLDDFILLRKNITLEKTFDIALLTILAGLFLGRVFYAVFNFDSLFLNPLVFLAFPRYEGFSLLGGIVGGILSLLYQTMPKKLPSAHLIDLFSLSLLLALPFGFLGTFISEIMLRKQAMFLLLIEGALYQALAIFFMFLFKRSKLKDGSLAVLFLIAFSIISLAFNIFENLGKGIISSENVSLAVFGLISLVFFAKQENFFLKF